MDRSVDLPLVEGYADLDELGSSGRSTVYRARQSSHDRAVALHVVDTGAATEADLERFRRDVAILTGFLHDNLVGVHALEETDDERPCVVMECLDGGTLRERIEAGPVPVHLAVDHVAQIAAGLDAAHDAGVIHGEIDAGDVVFELSGQAKLAGFGLRHLSSARTASRRADVADLVDVLRAAVGASGSGEGVPSDLQSLLEADAPASAAELARALCSVQRENGWELTGSVGTDRRAAPTVQLGSDAVLDAGGDVDGDDDPATGAKSRSRRLPTSSNTALAVAACFAMVLLGALGLGVRSLGLSMGDGADVFDEADERLARTTPTVATLDSVVLTGSIRASSSTGAPEDRAENLLDGDPTTAWRMLGDGDGATLELEFATEVHVDRVGMLLGPEDPDPDDDAIPFLANRRPLAVRYAFSDGTSVDYVFADTADVQFASVDVETTSITATILGTTEATDPDATAVSELVVLGSSG